MDFYKTKISPLLDQLMVGMLYVFVYLFVVMAYFAMPLTIIFTTTLYFNGVIHDCIAMLQEDTFNPVAYAISGFLLKHHATLSAVMSVTVAFVALMIEVFIVQMIMVYSKYMHHVLLMKKEIKK